ncbi:MAG: hypothetical protein IJZ94_01175 [Clostridia bacterium]|nr:hypothetical protein [Clostridia bacterium]
MKKISFNMNMIKKYKIELILAFAGILLLILPGAFSDKNSGSENGETGINVIEDNQVKNTVNDMKTYADAEAERLEAFLKDIKDVGDADVIIYVDTSSKTVNATEKSMLDEDTEETDSNGGKRVNSKLDESVTYKVIKDENGNESLIHVYDEYPEIKGVLIAAEGAKSSLVKEMIIDSVSRLYDIPVHKISVVEKGN